MKSPTSPTAKRQKPSENSVSRRRIEGSFAQLGEEPSSADEEFAFELLLV